MFNFRRSSRRPNASRERRFLRLESLEPRQMLSATPSPTTGYQDAPTGDVLSAPPVLDGAANSEPSAAEMIPLAVEGGPTLAPIANQSTAAGAAKAITLDPTIPGGGDVVIRIFAGDSFNNPLDVSVSIDPETHVATITPAAGVTGTLTLRAGVRSASAEDVEENYDFQTFTLDVLRPSLSPFVDPTTGVGVATTLTLSSSDPIGAGVEYVVVDPVTFLAPTHVAVEVNPDTGQVTLTPEAGFTGTIPLLAGVRSKNSPNERANFDTEAFTLQVSSTVTLADIEDIDVPGDKSVLVPLTGLDEQNQPVTYTFESSNDDVELELVSQQSQSIVLNVSGMDKDGNAFTGAIVLKLFEDLAPATTAQIKALVASGFYNSLTFHRVIDGFMAQAGANSGVKLSDEFNPGLTFNSRGLLAMANAGRDTSDAQFFITALTAKNSTDPIDRTDPLQNLNFRYTIFGQMVSGFDTYQKMITTNVIANPSIPGETSKPAQTITIVSASVITDTQNAVLRVTAPDGFTGDATITVTAHGAGGQTAQKTFTATGVSDNHVDPPFLGPVTNHSSLPNMPATFNLTSTDPSGGGVAYSIVDASTGNAPANVTVNITATGQVTLTPASGFTGAVNLLARVRAANAADAPANYDTQAFTFTVSSSTSPLLNVVANQTTTVNAAISFTLTSTDPAGTGVTYSVVDPGTLGAPANVTVNVTTAGQVTLTPATGFTGTIQLLARVRQSSAPDEAASYDTKTFTLTVSATGTPAAPTGLSIVAGTGSGQFDDVGYVSTATPILSVTAATGSTVKFKRNGVEIATATETAAGSGIFRATLPAGTLAIGANSITAVASNTTGTGADSTAMTVNYAPDYTGGVYVVPGAPGGAQSMTFAWTSNNAAYKNEFGYVIVDSATGAINNVSPGSPEYAQALLSSANRSVLFAKGQSAGAAATVTLGAGKFVVFYMIQNNTTANFLAKNPTNAPHGNKNSGAPLAFFSVQAANPDGMKHVQIVADAMTGFVQYNWEDLYSQGDGDFNDAAITARVASQTNATPGGIRAPGSTGNENLSGTLVPGSQSSPLGDVGVFFVDSPNGAIGSLTPGSTGYAAAALAASNIRVLFAGNANGTRSVAVPAGKYLGFYAITNGTTANFLAVNATNSTSGSAVALFSFDEANPDDVNHFRWVSAGSQADPALTQLHVMTEVGGGANDYDAFTINLKFTA
jgi:cyclophilin family peptidyl-prolyl cis-trans isomerase